MEVYLWIFNSRQFDYTSIAASGKIGPMNPKFTSSVVWLDRPKPARYSCVNEHCCSVPIRLWLYALSIVCHTNAEVTNNEYRIMSVTEHTGSHGNNIPINSFFHALRWLSNDFIFTMATEKPTNHNYIVSSSVQCIYHTQCKYLSLPWPIYDWN